MGNCRVCCYAVSRQNPATNETFYSTKNTSTHQYVQRNTTTAWYETRNDLIPTCNTNDQAKQCNSTRHVINKWTNQCRQPRASKPSYSPPLWNYTDQSPKRSRGFLDLVDRRRGGTSAHVCDRTEPVLSDGEVNPGDSVADRQGNWIRHCPHRSESSLESRQRLSWALRQLLETWETAPSQMWKSCFLGRRLDLSQNTSDYPPRVQPGRIRGRPCCEHGDIEEWGLDAITTKVPQNQSWPCGETAGSIHGEFH